VLTDDGVGAEKETQFVKVYHDFADVFLRLNFLMSYVLISEPPK
jgi:hypothetical protein